MMIFKTKTFVSLIFIYCVLYLPKLISALQIHEQFSHLFAADKVTTEYNAYKLLKEGALSFESEQNYVAIPWAVLINTKTLNGAATLPIQLEHGFTICQHINYEKILPIAKKMGINVVFTPHVTKDYEGINVLPFPHYSVNGIEPHLEKDIWFSFIGIEWSHPVRKKIFTLKGQGQKIVLKKRTKWFSNTPLEKKEYQNVLSRSRFSLCPRGTGASTIRFWESLQAGAIPVLISDAMRLPEGIDWGSCIIRVKESDVLNIPNILRTISLEQETSMKIKCIEVFQNFCAGKNFVNTIALYIK